MSHSPQTPTDDSTLHDVKQLGMWSAIGSLGYIFWVVGGVEMVERLAYYGVRAVATIYATRPTSEGGLGVTMATFGWLLLCWNLAQSVIPVFTGGLSDRYGYKQTIFLSTAIKVSGYLWMAWFHSYGGFFVGCMLLAVGTAIFKPGIQGTLIKATNRRNSSMAWGIFYQTVNIGGWIGPLIALHMRSRIGWTYVFYTNAAFICLNFLWLLTYREPGRAERLARQQRWRTGAERPPSLAREAWHELRKPHLALYLLIFSVWWFMFPMLWDVLPKYIEDWVDTTVIVRALFGPEGTTNPVFQFLLGMDAAGLSIQPEGIVNLNAGMIMLTFYDCGDKRQDARDDQSGGGHGIDHWRAGQLWLEPGGVDGGRCHGDVQRGRNAGQPEVQRVPRQHCAFGQEGDVDRVFAGAHSAGLDLGRQTRAAALSSLFVQGRICAADVDAARFFRGIRE